MKQTVKRFNPRFFMLDAGYDQMKNYEMARNVKAQAIIPMNPRNEKEPPAGMTSKGTPCCSMGFPMTYWGRDKKYLKFRCPHATGKVECPLGMAACSTSNYGMVDKVDAQQDLRRYATPHRESRGWQKLYNKRTSVERCNSRMKTYLTADQLHVWGIKKVTTHQYLNAIVLLASALAIAKQRVPKSRLKNFSSPKFCPSVLLHLDSHKAEISLCSNHDFESKYELCKMLKYIYG